LLLNWKRGSREKEEYRDERPPDFRLCMSEKKVQVLGKEGGDVEAGPNELGGGVTLLAPDRDNKSQAPGRSRNQNERRNSVPPKFGCDSRRDSFRREGLTFGGGRKPEAEVTKKTRNA